MGNSQWSHPFWEVWADLSETRLSHPLRLWRSGKCAFLQRILENCEVYLWRNLVSPNPKSRYFHYLKVVNLIKKLVGHLRFSWQPGTLMGQSYYKWIVISLLKRVVRFLHPSSCFFFFIPLWFLFGYTNHFRHTRELETKSTLLLER